MKKYRLTEMETRLAELIWINEPIPSGQLVILCQKEFGWKKSTTYTMLKRLVNKGTFENVNSVVTSLIKKDEFYSAQSKLFVDETFEGSLPRFVAAFTRNKRLSEKEIEELQRLIEEHKEEL
ncbi:MAG TPA: BlaI/MecI/CopY family transcriptional regulator [Anaerovoracaceae bacterium]|nr:BlaI/MecI/CopY family transcriptional regulator [Anaerovoracaceae bacterium]